MGRTPESLLQLSGWKMRVGLSRLAGMIALVVAGRSLAAVTPHLIVKSTETGTGQTLSIVASKQKADDPVGRVQLYVPTGFTLNSPASGSVGKATAKVVMRDVDPSCRGHDGRRRLGDLAAEHVDRVREHELRRGSASRRVDGSPQGREGLLTELPGLRRRDEPEPARRSARTCSWPASGRRMSPRPIRAAPLRGASSIRSRSL